MSDEETDEQVRENAYMRVPRDIIFLNYAATVLRAPRKINKSLDSGMILIMICRAFVLIAVGQRGFWDGRAKSHKALG
jgi:hypothetical protein